MSTLAEKPARLALSQENPAIDHIFVTNVRFLSMAGVVAIHCISMAFSLAGFSSSGGLERAMRQPVSFDVIGFFLISGFLIEEGLSRWRPAKYLERRFKRILAPWLFWYSLYFVILVAGDTVHGRLKHFSWRGDALYVFHSLFSCLFLSPYWFVPNLLIALCILVACRRFLFDRRLGGLLLTLSLFYGLNLYAHWIPIRDHTEALFGFVFYLWLGAWTARNFAAIQAWSARVSVPAFMALAALAGLAAFVESSVLLAAGNPHPMNTLRICNQAYSVILVLAIFKLRRPVWPRAVNVRATTFGIYLTHSIVMWFLACIIRRVIGKAATGQTSGWAAATAVCLSLGLFALTYSGSLTLSGWLIGHPRLRWMVGASASS
ncbi:MAG: acyltransferase [Terracidiphilus sp.]|jgi:peptidoglycan/LPS O-acetylase OafA/YrhL